MEIKTEVCDGYIVTIVDGSVFSVKPLPQSEQKHDSGKLDLQASQLLDDILKNVKKTEEEINKKRERFRKAWGYGNHWYKDYVA